MKDRIHLFLQHAFRAGVLLTLFIAPTQWSWQPRPKFNLSLADLSLALTAGAWLLDVLLRREWRRLKPPPCAQVLFVLAAGLSFAVAQDKAFAAKDIVQLVEFFIVGHVVFAAFLREQKGALRQSLAVLFVATAVNVGIAAAQYFSGEGVMQVRGTFGNRNVLGGYLALALPMALGVMLGVRQVWAKAALGLLLAAGFLVNLSGASYFAVAGVVACMAARRGHKVFIPVAACLLLAQVFVLPNLPRENDVEHFWSVALYDGDGVATKRYPEWQAAYNTVLTHPWLGVGMGNYQKRVGEFYDNVPQRTGPSEADTQNLYLVLAVSAGFPALLLFIVFLGGAVRKARAAAAHGAGFQSALGLGVGGALTAFAFAAVWHPLIVRGIGLPLVFALALAQCLAGQGAVKNDSGK